MLEKWGAGTCCSPPWAVAPEPTPRSVDVGASPSTASNVNFVSGQTVPNLVAVNGAEDDGKFKIDNTGGGANAGTVNIVVDIVGYHP